MRDTHAKSGSSLKQRVLHMARWTLIGFGAAQVLRLASNLLLTRLLAPEAFGVMSIGYAVLIALSMLSDMGLEPALVQRQKPLTPAFVNTIWSLQITRGAGVGAALMLFALGLYGVQQMGWVDPQSTFAAAELPVVLGILAFAPLISGFDSTNMSLASRNMQVAGLMKVQFLDSLFASIATIGIAWFFETVYAMPLGWLAGASLRMVLSHKALTGIPNKWGLDPESRTEIHGFGKWIFLSTAMTFVVSGGDRMLLGYYVNSQQMGLYAIAFLLASTAQTLLHKFNSVGLPLFSEVARERPSELPTLFYRLRLPVDVASLFIAGGLVGGSQFIIDLFYDPRYAGSAPMLAVLSLLVVASRYDLVSASWMALGHTKWLTVLSFFKMVTLLVALPLGFHLYGTLGAVWGIVAASMINHPLGWWFMRKTGLLNWRKELLPLPAALVGYGCGWAAQAAHAYLKAQA